MVHRQDIEGETKMVIKGFNTGRQYTSQGQRIAYEILDDNSRVIFADFDRMIYGEFDWFLSEEPRASEVMAALDADAPEYKED